MSLMTPDETLPLSAQSHDDSDAALDVPAAATEDAASTPAPPAAAPSAPPPVNAACLAASVCAQFSRAIWFSICQRLSARS